MENRLARFVTPALIGLALACGGISKAGPITYTIQTEGIGWLGNEAFDGAVELTFIGDTSDVVDAGSGVYYISQGIAKVTIAGLGTATFTEPIAVYVDQPHASVGFINSTSYDPNWWTLGILNLVSADYAAYDLKAPFGPFLGGGFTSFTTAGFATNRGALILPPPGSGLFSASVTAVPEPSGLALLCVGAMSLTGFGWCARRSRRG